MKNVCKLVLIALAATLFSVHAYAGQTLKMAIAQTETSSWMAAGREFKRLVEEGTEGRYTVDLYPNDQLAAGNQVKGLEMLFKGIVECDMHSAMTMPSFDPRIQVCFLPWMFKNGYEDIDKILLNGGPGGEMIKQMFREKGAVPLALGENGFRHITNNVRALKKPEDFKALKIRIPPLPLYIDLFTLLGADPVVMNYSEVFTALQQGTIDGQENPYDNIYSMKLYEVLKYMTICNYSYDPSVLSVSQRLWNSLSDADKIVFQNAADAACQLQVNVSRENNLKFHKIFEEAGMEIYTMTPEEIDVFYKLIEPLYEKYREEYTEEVFNAFGYYFKD